MSNVGNRPNPYYPKKFQVWLEHSSGQVFVVRTMLKSGVYVRMWRVRKDGSVFLNPTKLVNVVRLMQQDGYKLMGVIEHEWLGVPQAMMPEIPAQEISGGMHGAS